MIRALTVTNYLGQSKRFELFYPEKSGAVIQNIEGLGPSKAEINVNEMAVSDGAVFNSSRVSSRNIVISLKFLFNPQIEDVRHETYKYFPVKQRATLLFETDDRSCETYGYVESNEPDIFSENETTQISVICPDPYFYSERADSTVFYGVDPMFEFPFSNESLDEKLLIMGSIKSEMEETIYYSGDAETGVVITIHAVDKASNIAIYNTGTRELMRIDTDKLESITGSGIIARDEIVISTIRGDKYIRLLRNGVYYNILNCLDKDADWFRLSKGDNTFAYTAEEGVENLRFQVEYKRLYEGV